MHNVHTNQVADVATCQLSKHSPRNAGFPRLDGSVNHHYKTTFYGKIRA
nr:MAG TPA: hypothetical protein [Caudoviricetes sp.]